MMGTKRRKKMKVVSIKAQKDGSAILTLDMNRKEYETLMRQGMQLAVGDKFKVVPIEEAKALGIKAKKTYEITDAEADALVREAVLDALKRKIKECEKVKKGKRK